MNDISKLTPSEILGISKPEKLFSGPTAIEYEYRRLAKLWHPDRNRAPEATDVLSHVNVLFEQAKTKVETDSWETPGIFTFTDVSGKKYQVKYRRELTTELGKMYIGDHTITHLIQKEFEDLFRNGVKTIESLKRADRFANDKMQAEFSRYLPEIHAYRETPDHLVLVTKKNEDEILLQDVVKHFGGKLDPKHVAWIISTIYNLSCWLSFAKLSHNAIGLDTYFISPQRHSGSLYGGWWYSAEFGQKLIAVPAKTILAAPPKLTVDKIATAQTDLELIRLMAREMLGNASASALLMNLDIPNAMLNWARTASTSVAFNEYSSWDKVLKDSFGERRFVKLDIKPSDIYKE